MLFDNATTPSIDPTIGWRDVPKFPGYRVSDTGIVESRRNGRRWRVIRQQDFGRYPAVVMRRDGRSFCRRVHTLVLEAFVGPRPPGAVACHGDGNPGNNRLANLRWDTPKANARDTVKHGKIGRSGLNLAQVRSILCWTKAGLTHEDAAAKFGVTAGTIREIIARAECGEIPSPLAIEVRLETGRTSPAPVHTSKLPALLTDQAKGITRYAGENRLAELLRAAATEIRKLEAELFVASRGRTRKR